jgi:uncharacterized protein (TIGR03083 family)
MEHWDAIASEIVGLADQLEGLSPEQWATQSLCSEWTVRDVVAHLVGPRKMSMPRLVLPVAAAFVKARGNVDRANVALTAKEAKRPTAELVVDLRRNAGRHFKPPGFGSEAPLTDVLIHGQDIRIPLGLATDGPIDSWRVALEVGVTSRARRVFGLWPLDGLRFAATDLDWTYGNGDQVSGPAIALALALGGRDARVGDLAGPGVPRLTSRITSQASDD